MDPESAPGEGEEAPEWFLAYRAEMEGRLAKLEQEAHSQDAEIIKLEALVEQLAAELAAEKERGAELAAERSKHKQPQGDARAGARSERGGIPHGSR